MVGAFGSGRIGSAKANGRELKGCLGRVFHFKLGCTVLLKEVHGANARPYLVLKTRPGNTKGRSINVPLTSCLTGLESAV